MAMKLMYCLLIAVFVMGAAASVYCLHGATGLAFAWHLGCLAVNVYAVRGMVRFAPKMFAVIDGREVAE